jgi:hypothetical protein
MHVVPLHVVPLHVVPRPRPRRRGHTAHRSIAGLSALAALTVGCGGADEATIVLTADGVGEVEVAWSINGNMTTETVDVPWRSAVEVSGTFAVELEVRNLGDSGAVRCGVALETEPRGAPSATGGAAATCALSGSVSESKVTTSGRSSSTPHDDTSGTSAAGGTDGDTGTDDAEQSSTSSVPPTTTDAPQVIEAARPLASWVDATFGRGFVRLRLPPIWRSADDRPIEPLVGPPDSGAAIVAEDFVVVGGAETGLTQVGVFRFVHPLTRTYADIVEGVEEFLAADSRVTAVERSDSEVDGRPATRLSYSGDPETGVIHVVAVGDEVLLVQARWRTEYPETADEALGIISTVTFDQTALPVMPHRVADDIELSGTVGTALAGRIEIPADWTPQSDGSVPSGVGWQSPDQLSGASLVVDEATTDARALLDIEAEQRGLTVETIEQRRIGGIEFLTSTLERPDGSTLVVAAGATPVGETTVGVRIGVDVALDEVDREVDRDEASSRPTAEEILESISFGPATPS